MRVVRKNINEISKERLGAYADKAFKNRARRISPGKGEMFDLANAKLSAASKNPETRKKYSYGAKVPASVNEASKQKLLNYISKAVVDYGGKQMDTEKQLAAGQGVKALKTQDKAFDRQTGISRASRKLAGRNIKIVANEAAVKVVNSKTKQAVSEEVDIAVRSFYAKHYGKNYNRFISKKSPGSPVKKAVHSAYAHVGNKYGSEVEKQLRQYHAGNELKEEPINEVSADKLKRYLNKATKSYDNAHNEMRGEPKDTPEFKKNSKTAFKRVGGRMMAHDKIYGKSDVKIHAKEDTILEMSDGKIRQYIGKALGDTRRKRTKSINLAADKIEKKAKVPATLEEARNKPIPDHPYHLKTDAELKYIQKDAHEAAQNMKGHDAKAEEKYLDQVNDASTVLHYRKKHGKGKDEPKKLDEAMKLIKAHEQGGHVAKVYHDKEWGEYRVKAFPKDGSHREQEDYHTDSVEDAHSTAQHMLQQMNGDGGFKKKRLDEDDLTEARFKIVKARIRGGQVQRRKKVSTQPGWTLRGGKLKRMSASERRRRKLGQRRGKIKRRAKLSRTLVKRKRSLVKRQRLHLK